SSESWDCFFLPFIPNAARAHEGSFIRGIGFSFLGGSVTSCPPHAGGYPAAKDDAPAPECLELRQRQNVGIHHPEGAVNLRESADRQESAFCWLLPFPDLLTLVKHTDFFCMRLTYDQ
ncbi:hypothetical protein RZP29_29420, partial [Klebsiella quasipneumoniae subsp. similipneumoniae]